MVLLSDGQATPSRIAAYSRIIDQFPEARILPVDSDTLLLNLATADAEVIGQVQRYAIFGGMENLKNLFAWLGLLARYCDRCAAQPLCISLRGARRGCYCQTALLRCHHRSFAGVGNFAARRFPQAGTFAGRLSGSGAAWHGRCGDTACASVGKHSKYAGLILRYISNASFCSPITVFAIQSHGLLWQNIPPFSL